jgi:hypothetical protein
LKAKESKRTDSKILSPVEDLKVQSKMEGEDEVRSFCKNTNVTEEKATLKKDEPSCICVN